MSANSIYHTLNDVPVRPHCLTLGNFDGVHKGHLALIQLTLNQAKATNLSPLLITFEPHPLEYFATQVAHKNAPPRLTTLKERLRLLQATGIDILLLPFNAQLAALTAQEFVQQILLDSLQLHEMVVGYDFTLGCQRTGTPDVLQSLGKTHNFNFIQLAALKWQDLTISSSNIRKALLHGDIDLATACLGRPYSLYGLIVQGHQRGRHLGFPTANIGPTGTLLPKSGVYLTRSQLQNQTYTSLTNIGVKPTFQDHQLTVETHILDFTGDVYGQTLQLDFLARLRPEQEFNSIEDLKNQLQKDVCQARAMANNPLISQSSLT